jgi:serine protease AprX
MDNHTNNASRWLALVLGLVFVMGTTAPASAKNSGRGGRRPAKLSEAAHERSKAMSGGAGLDVIVRFKRAPGTSERSLVAKFGGRAGRGHRSRWMSARVPASAVDKLAEDSNVEFVALDAPISVFGMEASRIAAGLPESFQPESEFKGAGVTIAQMDTGVARRPELPGLVASVDLVGSYDSSIAPTGSVDPHGHGTHVAGIMVGNGMHSEDGRLAGIAPEASLVSIRVLNGLGQGSTSGMLAGLQWVLEHKDAYGIRVLNLSLGHPVYEPPDVDPLVQAVEELWDAGIVVVCSAGNAGRDGHGTISSPCNSRKVITVGALNDRKSDGFEDDTVATYSSRGPARFNLVAKPDLLAPGNKIWSTRSNGSTLDLQFPQSRIAGDVTQPWQVAYFELSGTSMAAPMVAGAAALLLEKDPSLNPATVKARLMLSARKAAVGDPFATGAGALDIVAALNATGAVADALSPLAFVESVDSEELSPETASGRMRFENTGVLWANPAFSLSLLWGSSVLWSDETGMEAAVLLSYGVLLPEATANAVLWPNAILWPNGTLWPESTLWSEAVLWPDSDFAFSVGALGAPVPDP